MIKEKDYFTYNLDVPIKYGDTKEGSSKESKVLTIYEPRPANLREITRLDQEFMAAQAEALKKLDTSGNSSEAPKAEKEESDIDKAKQILLLMNIGKADLMACYDSLRAILCSGAREKPVCTIGSEKLTSFLWDEISIKDKKNILGLYYVNFIVPSQQS